MFKLDDNLLRELGLGSLAPDEKNRMLGQIYSTLEMRVGMKLAEQMSNEQLDEFEGYIDRNDEPGALKWLETNFPNYKQVVADELEKLKTEIRNDAPKILAASAAMQNQPQPIGQPQAMYPGPQPPYQPAYQPPMPGQATGSTTPYYPSNNPYPYPNNMPQYPAPVMPASPAAGQGVPLPPATPYYPPAQQPAPSSMPPVPPAYPGQPPAASGPIYPPAPPQVPPNSVSPDPLPTPPAGFNPEQSPNP